VKGGRLALLLLLASCQPPATEEDAAREERIRMAAVCSAYDDLRARLQVDTTDAGRVELHRAAMEVCDGVSAGM
jgi:hypothetical protein